MRLCRHRAALVAASDGLNEPDERSRNTWEAIQAFLKIHGAWTMEFEDGWYAYFNDEKRLGPFAREQEEGVGQ
jgi:hypothetical protein